MYSTFLNTQVMEIILPLSLSPIHTVHKHMET